MEVAVQRHAVEQAIRLCETLREEYLSTSQQLRQQTDQAGTGWRDQKYQQLRAITDECSTTLERSARELEGSAETLRQLLAAIDEYDSTDIA